MIVKMMKWRPWLSSPTKKFEVKLTVHSLEGLSCVTSGKSSELQGGPLGVSCARSNVGKVGVHVKWRGSRGTLGSRFRRSLKRAKTAEKLPEDGPLLKWEEEFAHVCVLSMGRNGHFVPWDIYFVVTQAGLKSKRIVLGMATLNIAEFAASAMNKRQTLKIPVLYTSGVASQITLAVSVEVVELRTVEHSVYECFMAPTSLCINGSVICDLDDQQLGEVDAVGFPGDVNNLLSNDEKEAFGQLVGATFIEDLSPKSTNSSENSRDSFESDDFEDWGEEETGTGEDQYIPTYGPLVGVNLVVEGALSHCKEHKQVHEEVASIWNRPIQEDLSRGPDDMALAEFAIQTPSTMQSILAWRKRKLNFRSPKQKGQPLLNKDYGEDGGDDIDFDRRLTGSPIEPLTPLCQGSANGILSPYDFGDECFAIGSWEKKDVFSRDGQMKLSGNVFFATIDQRNERASGESACTALVAVIAAWLHQNPNRMPIKAEFDTLIREGSSEWRKLCENEAFKDRFPDKHFDLDTVLQSQVRPVVEVPERSFVGFFQPEGLGESCDFLHGAMSFDKIWEEIIHGSPEQSSEPAIYIVSWNDHFFILKVEDEVCYIIDTLGERLYEGCNQAYMLRFDKDTIISHVPVSKEAKQGQAVHDSLTSPGRASSLTKTAPCRSPSPGRASSLTKTAPCRSPSRKPIQSSRPVTSGTSKSSTSVVMNSPSSQGFCLPQASSVVPHQKDGAAQGSLNNHGEKRVVYRGKDACKHFIKGFFAALPLRELELDVKKGLTVTVHLHHRLQIEFHYTLIRSAV